MNHYHETRVMSLLRSASERRRSEHERHRQVKVDANSASDRKFVEAVESARQLGADWADISEATGLSRQVVWKMSKHVNGKAM